MYILKFPMNQNSMDVGKLLSKVLVLKDSKSWNKIVEP